MKMQQIKCVKCPAILFRQFAVLRGRQNYHHSCLVYCDTGSCREIPPRCIGNGIKREECTIAVHTQCPEHALGSVADSYPVRCTTCAAEWKAEKETQLRRLQELDAGLAGENPCSCETFSYCRDGGEKCAVCHKTNPDIPDKLRAMMESRRAELAESLGVP